MFENNWSVEQIEQELTACRGELFDAGKLEGAEAGSAADGGAIRIATLLAKMSDVLENQALFRGEIRSLRDEVASLRQERDVAEAHQREEVGPVFGPLGGKTKVDRFMGYAAFSGQARGGTPSGLST